MCRKKNCLGYPASIGTAVPAFYFPFCFGGGFCTKRPLQTIESAFFLFLESFRLFVSLAR